MTYTMKIKYVYLFHLKTKLSEILKIKNDESIKNQIFLISASGD